MTDIIGNDDRPIKKLYKVIMIHLTNQGTTKNEVDQMIQDDQFKVDANLLPKDTPKYLKLILESEKAFIDYYNKIDNQKINEMKDDINKAIKKDSFGKGYLVDALRSYAGRISNEDRQNFINEYFSKTDEALNQGPAMAEPQLTAANLRSLGALGKRARNDEQDTETEVESQYDQETVVNNMYPFGSAEPSPYSQGSEFFPAEAAPAAAEAAPAAAEVTPEQKETAAKKIQAIVRGKIAKNLAKKFGDVRAVVNAAAEENKDKIAKFNNYITGNVHSINGSKEVYNVLSQGDIHLSPRDIAAYEKEFLNKNNEIVKAIYARELEQDIERNNISPAKIAKYKNVFNDLNEIEVQGKPVMVFAAELVTQQGNPHRIGQLAGLGFDINAEYNGKTAIAHAAEQIGNDKNQAYSKEIQGEVSKDPAAALKSANKLLKDINHVPKGEQQVVVYNPVVAKVREADGKANRDYAEGLKAAAENEIKIRNNAKSAVASLYYEGAKAKGVDAGIIQEIAPNATKLGAAKTVYNAAVAAANKRTNAAYRLDQGSRGVSDFATAAAPYVAAGVSGVKTGVGYAAGLVAGAAVAGIGVTGAVVAGGVAGVVFVAGGAAYGLNEVRKDPKILIGAVFKTSLSVGSAVATTLAVPAAGIAVTTAIAARGFLFAARGVGDTAKSAGRVARRYGSSLHTGGKFNEFNKNLDTLDREIKNILNPTGYVSFLNEEQRNDIIAMKGKVDAYVKAVREGKATEEFKLEIPDSLRNNDNFLAEETQLNSIKNLQRINDSIIKSGKNASDLFNEIYDKNRDEAIDTTRARNNELVFNSLLVTGIAISEVSSSLLSFSKDMLMQRDMFPKPATLNVTNVSAAAAEATTGAVAMNLEASQAAAAAEAPTGAVAMNLEALEAPENAELETPKPQEQSKEKGSWLPKFRVLGNTNAKNPSGPGATPGQGKGQGKSPSI